MQKRKLQIRKLDQALSIAQLTGSSNFVGQCSLCTVLGAHWI